MKSAATKRNKRRRTLFIVLVVALAIAGGGYFYYTTQLNTGDEVTDTSTLQTTTARRGDIVITAMGSGNLVANTEVQLGFRSGGTLVDLMVSTGDKVESGQILALLDDTAAKLQVAQAELNLEQAEQKLKDLQDSTAQTLAIAQANLEAAQADYDTAVEGTRYTWDKLTSARVNFEQATEQLALAEQAYNTAFDPGREWELSVKNRATALENERIAATRALEKAKDDLEIARSNYNLAVFNLSGDSATQAALIKLLTAEKSLDEVASGADIQGAEWSVRQSSLALQSAQLALENTVLRAPVAGTVIAVAANVGEAVGTNPILTLADLITPQIRFYLDESELPKISTGNPVNVVFDALPDQTFPGAITKIDPVLATVDGTSAIQALASLDLSSTDRTLPVGLTAEVEIIAGEAYKTLLVPVQALRELAPGQYAVFVVGENDELKLRPVEVGLRDFANAQILNGLEAGEIVSTGTVETE